MEQGDRIEDKEIDRGGSEAWRGQRVYSQSEGIGKIIKHHVLGGMACGWNTT